MGNRSKDRNPGRGTRYEHRPRDSEFEEAFVECMRIHHGAQEVLNTVAYKTYSSNSKSHGYVSITETSWPGFVAFLKHLEAAGKCKLRNQSGTLYLSMIFPQSDLEAALAPPPPPSPPLERPMLSHADRVAAAIESASYGVRQCSENYHRSKSSTQQPKKRASSEEAFLEEQVERAYKAHRSAKGVATSVPSCIDRSEKFSLSFSIQPKKTVAVQPPPVFAEQQEKELEQDTTAQEEQQGQVEEMQRPTSGSDNHQHGQSHKTKQQQLRHSKALEQMAEELQKEVKRDRGRSSTPREREKSSEPANQPSRPREGWLDFGVVAKFVRGRYSGTQCVVEDIRDSRREADVRLLTEKRKEVSRVPIEHLEMVLPQGVGDTVKVVKGFLRWHTAKVVSMDESNRRVTIDVLNQSQGRKLYYPDVGLDEVCSYNLAAVEAPKRFR